MAISSILRRTREQASLMAKRASDRHVRLAVTGLSGSGKTAFITSLVQQLSQGNLPTHLPLFSVVRERRLYSAERVMHADMTIPAFRYRESMSALDQKPPQWPASTRGLSELRLKIDFHSSRSHWFNSSPSTLWLDIVDYPGEWLLDLPLLKQNYRVWSQTTHNLLREAPRLGYMQPWLDKLEKIDWLATIDPDQLVALATEYAQLLQKLREEEGLSLLQPGRLLLPGELAGAPVLQLFPIAVAHWPAQEEMPKDCALRQLEQRFEAYKKQVITPFYEKHFRYFDRQIVLIDCFTALNKGFTHCQDMAQSLALIMESFRYGRQSWLTRLFNPNIDKVLFAASKSDHVTREQFTRTESLIRNMTEARLQTTDDVAYGIQSLAAVRCTHFGQARTAGETVPTVRGVRLDNRQSITLFPGDVPVHLPEPEFFAEHPFNFVQFAPLSRQHEFEPLPHIAMDKALEFLLGDKLI